MLPLAVDGRVVHFVFFFTIYSIILVEIVLLKNEIFSNSGCQNIECFKSAATQLLFV